MPHTGFQLCALIPCEGYQDNSVFFSMKYQFIYFSHISIDLESFFIYSVCHIYILKIHSPQKKKKGEKEKRKEKRERSKDRERAKEWKGERNGEGRNQETTAYLNVN